MKPTDELTMLKEWIAEQREIYNNSHFETDAQKIDAIERQLVLQEVILQLQIFEQLSREYFIDNMPKASHITPEFTSLLNTLTTK